MCNSAGAENTEDVPTCTQWYGIMHYETTTQWVTFLSGSRYTAVIPELRKLRQEESEFARGQPGLHREILLQNKQAGEYHYKMTLFFSPIVVMENDRHNYTCCLIQMSM